MARSAGAMLWANSMAERLAAEFQMLQNFAKTHDTPAQRLRNDRAKAAAVEVGECTWREGARRGGGTVFTARRRPNGYSTSYFLVPR